jgi:hypothetical protein
MESVPSIEDYETNLDYLDRLGYITIIVGDNGDPTIHLSPEGKQWVSDNGEFMNGPIGVYCWTFEYIILTTTTSSPTNSIWQISRST